ncbi:Hemicentin 2 [Mactra antiquata]
MYYPKVILVTLTHCIFNILLTEALQCLSCDHVAEPRDCSHLETCGAHQECYVKHMIASNLVQYYEMGCKDKRVCETDTNSLLMSAVGKKRDTTIRSSHWYSKRNEDDLLLCLQCCNGTNGCNKDLCGAPQTTARRCLQCDDVLSWRDCQEIAECSTDQLCYVRTSAISINYEIRVKMGCLGQLQCEGIQKAFPQRCVVCCNDADFCNYNACDNFNVSTRATTTATTPVIPILTLKPTNPPPSTTDQPTVHINGPTTATTYGNMSSLTCLTIPPAGTYTWTFKDTTQLPAGVSAKYGGTTSGGFAGISVLHLDSLDRLTAGQYTCTAAFANGVQHKDSFLLEPLPVKPTTDIEKGPITTNFALKCMITGYPSPTVTWTLNGNIVTATQPPNIYINVGNSTSTVFVYAYDPSSHNGQWSCTAQNAGGQVSTIATIP